MSTSFLIWTFFISLFGIFGVLGDHILTRKREHQRKIREALAKDRAEETSKESLPQEKTIPLQDFTEREEFFPEENTENIEEETPQDFVVTESIIIEIEEGETPMQEDRASATSGSATPPSYTPQEIRNLLNRAEVFLARNDYPEAEKLFIKILAFDSDHPVALQKLAYLYLQTEAYQKAETLYRELVEISPKNPAVYTNLGLALFNQKNFEEAIEAYKKAIDLEPDRGARYANLGQVYFVIKDMESALECFREAIRKEPKNIDFLYLLADTCLEAKHFVEAKKWYERVLDISPYDESAKEEVRRLVALGF